jgi:RHS repeat-associated protein
VSGGSCGPDSSVDLETGLFVDNGTDLHLSDVISLDVARVYRQNDPYSRWFGVGGSFVYGMFLYQPNNDYRQVNLVAANGGQVKFLRTSPGTGHDDAVFQSTAAPGMFSGARIVWNTDRYGWDLTLKSGMVYQFSDLEAAGLNAILLSIIDRHGNALRAVFDNGSLYSGFKSPNGRWVQFTYTAPRGETIAQVTDDLGRTVSYGYTPTGCLGSVTDANGGVTTYSYDGSNRLQSVTDPRGHVTLTLGYDSLSRIASETLADGSSYQIGYVVDASNQTTQASVTDRRGAVEQVAFNSDGYVTGITAAAGTAQQQTYAIGRQPGSDLIIGVTDALGRQTARTYDANGIVTSVTRLAGTGQAQTYHYAHDAFGDVTAITDPLNHTTSFSYDASGSLTKQTDPLGHSWKRTYNSEGEVLTLTDPLAHKTKLTYTFGDVTATTDPVGRTARQYVDAVGRPTTVTDALGDAWSVAYDNLNRVTSVADPLGQSTSTTYDADENVQSITDPRGGTTYYTYTATNQLCATTDPLAGASSPPTTCPTTATAHTTVYTYDAGGNLAGVIDRRGKTTSVAYDALDRPKKITFAGGSTLTPSYDQGNRLTQLADSVSGTVSAAYDGVDRMTSETDPQAAGTVSCNSAAVSICYTYDAIGNRTAMTVAGQTPVAYSYDNANRLTTQTQGTSTVTMTYDNANRQSSLTAPDGIIQTYTYDAANQLTAISYAKGAATLGNLAYGYDRSGRQITTSGSWARTNIPPVVSSTSYNAANELTKWGGANLTYDANGNLTGDGTDTYTWNTRDQLVGISGGSTASYGYDATGRRVSTTVGGATTEYLHDGLNVVQELTAGTPSANFLDGQAVNQYYAFTTGGNRSSLLTDAIGSTDALADDTGTVQTQYTYDPYGAATASGATSANPIQYAGMENDGTGQSYDHARYYDPGLSRFTSQDPIGCSGSEANLYRYVSDDPSNLTDPLGLSDCGAFEIGLGIGLGLFGLAAVGLGIGLIADPLVVEATLDVFGNPMGLKTVDLTLTGVGLVASGVTLGGVAAFLADVIC